MKLLFLSWAFPPMHYPRAVQVGRLVRYLDCSVDVVCCDEASSDFSFLNEAREVRVERVGVSSTKQFLDKVQFKLFDELQYNPDPHKSWAMKAADYIIKHKNADDYDCLVTFGQPMSDHLAGLKVAKSLGLRWIAHFSDPWVDNPFAHRAGKILEQNKVWEKEVIEMADQVIFTSQETLDLVMSKYPAQWKSKADVLPHAFEQELYPEPAAQANGVKIRYLGNFYGIRTPAPLIDALIRIHESAPHLLKGVSFEVYGGMEKGMLQKMPLDELPNDILTFYPSVSYDDSLKLMVDADLLLVIDAPSDLSIFLPSKLVDYVGSNTPVFGITSPGTAAQLIHRLGGEVADPKDPESVVVKLSRMLEKLHQAGENGSLVDQDLRACFGAGQVAARFTAIVRNLLSETSK